MKLKEKLCTESIDRIVIDGDCSVPSVAWLDGFEKARALCAESLNMFTVKVQWSGRLLTGGYMCEGESKEAPLSEHINRIGEEEV